MNVATLPAVHDHSKRFYLAMGVLMLAIVSAAFTQRYYARALTAAPALPLFVHVHALLFTTWLALFVVQAVLVRQGLLRYHRQLGVGSMLLAVVTTLAGIYSAIEGARRGHNPGGAFPNALAFLIVGLGDIALFASFVAAGWWFRKRREAHKRLMLFATLGGFLWPAVTRLPMVAGHFPAMLAVTLIVLFMPAMKDGLARRHIHGLDIFGACAIALSIPLRRIVGASEAWQQFAAWLVG